MFLDLKLPCRLLQSSNWEGVKGRREPSCACAPSRFREFYFKQKDAKQLSRAEADRRMEKRKKKHFFLSSSSSSAAGFFLYFINFYFKCVEERGAAHLAGKKKS